MIWLRQLIALSLLIFGTSLPAAADMGKEPDILHHGNDSAALRHLRLLAGGGDARAQFRLGMMCATGQGVRRDYQAAARWLEKSAEQGNPRAENNLGALYDQGRGLAQDSKKAAYWYRKAAEQGNAAAEVNLASLYQQGRGVPLDAINAFAWASAAGRLGEPGAEGILRGVAKNMTPTQIKRAQKIARSYRNTSLAG